MSIYVVWPVNTRKVYDRNTLFDLIFVEPTLTNFIVLSRRAVVVSCRELCVRHGKYTGNVLKNIL